MVKLRYALIAVMSLLASCSISLPDKTPDGKCYIKVDQVWAKSNDTLFRRPDTQYVCVIEESTR